MIKIEHIFMAGIGQFRLVRDKGKGTKEVLGYYDTRLEAKIAKNDYEKR